MNEELEITWKKTVMAQSRYHHGLCQALPQNYLLKMPWLVVVSAVTQKTHNTVNLYSSFSSGV
jgi:hypothetical protein